MTAMSRRADATELRRQLPEELIAEVGGLATLAAIFEVVSRKTGGSHGRRASSKIGS